MNILLTGGTGFIGQFLVKYLLQEGHTITVLTRSPRSRSIVKDQIAPQPLSSGTMQHGAVQFAQWDARSVSTWAEHIETTDAVVHLAGEGIFDGRWTPEVKHRLIASRVESTQALVKAMRLASRKPAVFVSASAVGYYGNRHDEPTDESAPAGQGFLADICVRWEQESRAALDCGIRVANPRIGIVLHPKGGALQRMIIPFQLFVGAPLGSGKQWFPWIHIEDAVRGLAFALTAEHLNGAYNLASPNPVTMSEFCNALGAALHRPSWQWLAVPEIALELLLGEAASSLTGGQRIVPKVLHDVGFTFLYPDLLPALNHLLRR
jgi:uncharacterized protein (TIGR01777 family)